MSFDESRGESIRLICDSAKFIASPERIAKVRAQRYGLPGVCRDDWKAAAELGWLGMRVAEARGGSGFGVPELCALAECLGAGLVAEPLLQAIAIAPLAPDDWLARIISGEVIVLPAWSETRGITRDDFEARVSAAKLNGRKVYVPMAAAADAFLVATRDGLAIATRSAAGLTLTTDLLQDGGHFGSLNFKDTPVERVNADFEAAREEITLAFSAYLLGVMQRAFAIASEYLGVRRQFGKPIGSFQALQHRMVDLYIQIELTRASVQQAAITLEGTASVAAKQCAVSRAKARASDAAMFVTRQAVQLHGGIGYTDECDVGLYLRKAMVMAGIHGTAAQHRARFARLSTEEIKS